jgi:RNA-directed DNA polymerase
LAAVSRHAQQGFRWVVDADIEQFLDMLDHQQLMAALRQRISDGEVLRLIYRWLKAGYLLEGVYHDTDQGSPQGGVLSPLLANVYLHAFDQAQQQQQSFVGRLTRYADDFVIQCGTEAHARRARAWVEEQMHALGLRLHPEKTRVVLDRDGFAFLGFQHQRLILTRTGRESRGVFRWPGKPACRRFREQVRQLVGPPQRLRSDWSGRLTALRRYLAGWHQYYRHGESDRVFARLDWWVVERVARNYARSQPRGKRRRPRTWRECWAKLLAWGKVPRLAACARQAPGCDRGRANVRWKAV